jgi:DNA (cytosine-5)-methyltransferase 1
VKVLSLFTGAGGLDLGLEAAGFETAAAVENDPAACKTLAENIAWPVIAQDIHGVSSAEILRVAGLEVSEATMLVGGPPCQPFSKSGFWATGDVRRLGDPRASTIEEFLRVLADTKPLVYLLENVPGFGYRQKDEGLRLFKTRLEALNNESRKSRGGRVNYSCHVGVLDASDYGVPQRRTRLFVVGHREGKPFDFGQATHRDEMTNGQRNAQLVPGQLRRRAWDAIGRWEDDDDPALAVTGKWAELLPSVPEGENYLYFTERGEGEHLFGWRRRYWSFLLKLARSEPSWTITAQPGPATGPFHWRNRRLSPRELAALQTFPEGYRVTGDLRAIQRQLGNAVPSALAEYLGLQIRVELLGQAASVRNARRLVPKRRSQLPPRADPQPVPPQYRYLIGRHAPHPGTGLGPGAVAR